MNTKFIQDKNLEVYQKFFSENPLVTSAPGSFFWAGEYSVMEGGLAITQKIPLRVFVGLTFNSSKEIELKSTKNFQYSTNNFIEFEYEEPLKTKLLSFLDNYLKERNFGLIISTISEIPIGCGLNTSGAFAVALATAILLLNKKLSLQDIVNFQKTPISQLSQNENFDKVFRLAWKIECILHGDISSGTTAFTPFIFGDYPVVYFSEKRGGAFDDLAPGCRFPKNIAGQYDVLDKIFYQGISFNELFKFKTLPSWPIDFGLIYSGDVRTTATTNIAVEEVRDILKDCSFLNQKIFGKYLENKPYPDFYNIGLEKEWRKLWDKYIDALNVAVLETLNAFGVILKEGLTTEGIKKFFRAINSQHLILKVINLSSPILDYIGDFIQKEVKRLKDEYGAGCKLLGSGKKGDILFAVAYHGLRDSIDRIIKQMREETKEDIWLDYASWIDGIEKEGIKIEQYLDEKIYSKFISPGSLLLEKYFGENPPQLELISLENFEKKEKEIDLLLDIPDKKILIRGKKITSEDIPSSSATIKILLKLLENLGKSVYNRDLPASVYTRDRNELQSKITSPLINVVKKLTGKVLPLKVTGGLVDFYLKLESSNITICLLKQRF